VENIYKVSLLLDFYGQLLTDKQYEVLDLYYNGDYSLGEIAEHLNISRQGVYDKVKRGKALIDNFEEKLGLVRKFSEQKIKAEEILQKISSIDTDTLNKQDKEKMFVIKEKMQDMIKEL
jgi:predicted DNA-binding protein YlxM (UPF0122 family)